MIGIPFVMTNAMKDALRRCGLAEADIDEMTPTEARKLLETPDPHAVRMFFKIFVDLAARSLSGHPAPGCLQMSRKIRTMTISFRPAIAWTAPTLSSAWRATRWSIPKPGTTSISNRGSLISV